MKNPAKIIEKSITGNMPGLLSVLKSFDAQLEEQLIELKALRELEGEQLAVNKKILKELKILNGVPSVE